MYVRTRAQDCLYLNWALPRESAPELPDPLRYEVHEWRGAEWIFASALLFRVSGLHFESLPLARVSYPQMTLRVYVIDGAGVPSVLFRRMLLPFWVAPFSKLVGRQPASVARFSYPASASDPTADSWTWSIHRLSKLQVAARMASPQIGPGPDLGSWEATVEYFRYRMRGYVLRDDRLRPAKTSQPSLEVLPLAAEVSEAGLVAESFCGIDGGIWRSPHSAWLCPEIPFLFELNEIRALAFSNGRVAAARGC